MGGLILSVDAAGKAMDSVGHRISQTLPSVLTMTHMTHALLLELYYIHIHTLLLIPTPPY